MKPNIPAEKYRLEQAFYAIPLAHYRGCELEYVDSCTCGAQDARDYFKDLMTKLFRNYHRAVERTK